MCISSVTSDDDYGRLSGRKLDEMQAGARIEVGEAKDHPMDFALWKAAKEGEISWDSPWGKGRPGWHIECSAMNLAELGEQIDIHGGGNDLIFPHHENEIAQSECYTGKEFARYWIHNGMLQLGGEKMSKSLGNMVTIKNFLSKREADVMRMLVLNGTYRAPLTFNDDTLDAAQKNVERLKSALRPASPSASGLNPETLSALATASETAKASFIEAMDNDFNTAGAIAALFELSKFINTARDNNATDEQLKPAQGSFPRTRRRAWTETRREERLRRRGCLHQPADRSPRGSAQAETLGALRPDPRQVEGTRRDHRRQQGWDEVEVGITLRNSRGDRPVAPTFLS